MLHLTKLENGKNGRFPSSSDRAHIGDLELPQESAHWTMSGMRIAMTGIQCDPV